MAPWSRAVKTRHPCSLPGTCRCHGPSLRRAIQHQPEEGPTAALRALPRTPGTQARSRPPGSGGGQGGPHSKACPFFLASLGGSGGGSSKLHINVEESVDGKVVSSRKREV